MVIIKSAKNRGESPVYLCILIYSDLISTLRMPLGYMNERGKIK